MKPTTIMVAVGLVVAACGDTKSDVKKAIRELASENAAATKEQSYANSMKSDLRNLMTGEEMYFTNHRGKYTANLESIRAMKGEYSEDPVLGTRFPTPENSTPHITLTGAGWTATIQNPNTRQVCAIFVGNISMPPATREGTPACG
jgi:hypothetical protein